MLNIHSYETFGTHEGPGIRLVIFAQGCNLRCRYCHNPDTQEVKGGKSISTQEILDLLEKEKPYFSNGGGLTVSGGEPTLQAKELCDVFSAAKAKGFHTVLDTAGSIFNEDVIELYKASDLVILDVKHIDPKKHELITGKSNENTLKCAQNREASGKPMWLRYVLVPGYSDDPEDINRLGRHFHDYRTIERVEILPYHTLGVHKYRELKRTYPLEGVDPPTTEVINKTKAIFEKYFNNVITG